MPSIGQKKANKSKTGTYTSSSGKVYTSSSSSSSSKTSTSSSTPGVLTGAAEKAVRSQIANIQTGINDLAKSQGKTLKKNSDGSYTAEPIDASQMGAPKIPELPSKPQPQNYSAQLQTAVGQVNPIQTEAQGTQSAQDLFKSYLDNQQAPPDLASIQKKLEKDNQIRQKQEAVNNYQTQLNQIVSKAQADTLAVTGQGRGIPEVIIGGQQAQINKEASIQALPIQALLSSAQGDLEMAQAHVDKMFNIYAQDAENEVKHYNSQASMVYEFLSKQQQNQVDSIKEEKKFQQSLLVSKMNAQQDYASEFLKTGNKAGFSAISAIQPPTNINSPTYAEDLASYDKKVNAVLSKYGGSLAPKATGGSTSAPTVKTINGTDMQWNSTTGKWETIDGGGATVPDVKKSLDQIGLVEKSLANATALAGASGRSGARKKFEEYFVGSTDYTNLIAETNTLRTNVLTMATDPSIKKFFGPQMSNADVQLMTSAGTTLNPELQSPEKLREELIRLDDLVTRARQAVTQGEAQIAKDGDTKLYKGITYKVVNGVWTPQ